MKFLRKNYTEEKILPTYQEILEMVAECNRLYFGNMLKPCAIQIKDMYNYGEFHCDIDEKHNVIVNPLIVINISKARSKKKFMATIAHELLHYKVMSEIPTADIERAVELKNKGNLDIFNEIMFQDRYAHTGKWKTLAEDINRIYKLNIHLR